MHSPGEHADVVYLEVRVVVVRGVLYEVCASAAAGLGEHGRFSGEAAAEGDVLRKCELRCFYD